MHSRIKSTRVQGAGIQLFFVDSNRLLGTVLIDLKEYRKEEQIERNQLKHEANYVPRFPVCAGLHPIGKN